MIRRLNRGRTRFITTSTSVNASTIESTFEASMRSDSARPSGRAVARALEASRLPSAMTRRSTWGLFARNVAATEPIAPAPRTTTLMVSKLRDREGWAGLHNGSRSAGSMGY